MTYVEKLRDPRWQKRRLEILAAAEWTCCACGSTRQNLQVHHTYYVSHRQPWNYPDFCHEVLCESCHAANKYAPEERLLENGTISIRQQKFEFILSIFGGTYDQEFSCQMFAESLAAGWTRREICSAINRLLQNDKLIRDILDGKLIQEGQKPDEEQTA